MRVFCFLILSIFFAFGLAATCAAEDPVPRVSDAETIVRAKFIGLVDYLEPGFRPGRSKMSVSQEPKYTLWVKIEYVHGDKSFVRAKERVGFGLGAPELIFRKPKREIQDKRYRFYLSSRKNEAGEQVTRFYVLNEEM